MNLDDAIAAYAQRRTKFHKASIKHGTLDVTTAGKVNCCDTGTLFTVPFKRSNAGRKNGLEGRFTQTGFTLIELIMVIVILGVLAATGLPRFISMRGDANDATIRAKGGAMLSGANVIYAKSAILGVQSQALTNIDINGDGVNDVEVVYGYPSAHRSNGIPKVMGSNFASGWTWSADASNNVFWLTTASLGRRSGLYINNTAVAASNCYLLYSRATTSAPPTIAYVTTGC